MSSKQAEQSKERIISNKDESYAQRSDPAPTDFLTLGLSQSWHPIYNWAVKNAVLSELVHVINVTCLQDAPTDLLHLLRKISEPMALECLRRWEKQIAASYPLVRLANAVTFDNSCLAIYPRSLTERSRSAYGGHLETRYLAALQAERMPLIAQKQEAWFGRLRLWIFTHAISRYLLERAHTQDAWIREAASKLRIAFDMSGEWRTFFSQVLCTDAVDFDGISGYILYRQQRLKDSGKYKEIPNKYWRLVCDLVHVANFDSNMDSKKHEMPHPISTDWIATKISDDQYGRVNAEDIEDNEGQSAGQVFTSSEDSDDFLFAYKTNPKQSYFHQVQAGTGILLHGSEELQYLPYSWNRPNKYEIDRINRWLDSAYRSKDPAVKLLSGIIALGLMLGRTFKRTLDLRVSADVSEDWSLDHNLFVMRRLPPRRKQGWQPKTALEIEWVLPAAKSQTIPLTSELKFIFKVRLAENPTAMRIGELWERDWPATPEESFRRHISTVAPRVTGSMIANYLPERVYKDRRDATFARFLASHPQSTLPAAGAYVSWSSRDCAIALGDVGAKTNDNDSSMGSLLDPIECRLRESIRQAADAVEQVRRSGNLIGFHNAFAAYHVMCIFC